MSTGCECVGMMATGPGRCTHRRTTTHPHTWRQYARTVMGEGSLPFSSVGAMRTISKKGGRSADGDDGKGCDSKGESCAHRNSIIQQQPDKQRQGKGLHLQGHLQEYERSFSHSLRCCRVLNSRHASLDFLLSCREEGGMGTRDEKSQAKSNPRPGSRNNTTHNTDTNWRASVDPFGKILTTQGMGQDTFHTRLQGVGKLLQYPFSTRT